MLKETRGKLIYFSMRTHLLVGAIIGGGLLTETLYSTVAHGRILLYLLH